MPVLNTLDAIREIKKACKPHNIKLRIYPTCGENRKYRFLDMQEDDRELMQYDNLAGAYIAATDGSLFAYLTAMEKWR